MALKPRACTQTPKERLQIISTVREIYWPLCYQHFHLAWFCTQTCLTKITNFVVLNIFINSFSFLPVFIRVWLHPKPFLLCFFLFFFFLQNITQYYFQQYLLKYLAFICKLLYIPASEVMIIYCSVILGPFWSQKSNISDLGTHCIFRGVLKSDKLI